MILKKRIFYLLLILSFLFIIIGCDNRPLDFSSFNKIDAHVHLRTDDSFFIEQSMSDRFQLLTICTRSSNQADIDQQLAYAIQLGEQFPDIVSYATTFSMENWGNPDWGIETINRLKKDFDSGAIAVKVWKDIGMTFRDNSGNFIMIDDPGFDPILDFIASENKTLVAHNGEPKNCWLPLDSMTVNSDRSYFERNPQYHMYLHPEYPSYEEQIAARDRMLGKHPDLRVVGAHLASLEWSIDELAKRLDQFPNLVVDVTARICHFQIQDRENVRNFIIKYQDRILYGTDLSAAEESDKTELQERIHNVWIEDWNYFTTDQELTSAKVNQPFRGLQLSKSIIEKIYYKNAVRWYPGIVR